MKTLLVLLGLLGCANAWSQATTSAFDGNYERREWRNKERPMLDSDLTIKGTSGSFQQFAMKKAKSDACSGKVVPIEVLKTEGDKITFTVKLSQIMPQCQDFTATFQSVNANGKSGLAIPSSDDVMFVKK